MGGWSYGNQGWCMNATHNPRVRRAALAHMKAQNAANLRSSVIIFYVMLPHCAAIASAMPW